ncbi:MAG: helix-turn-helix transcriptional regulator [Spirochaetaceae bacterium]|nr:helix-turn-helix transcriptional regulator [Spirochaetaceae bacterium]
MDVAQLGAVVRYHRKRAGLTQIECARLAGVGKTALFDLEKGKPTVQLATVLAVCGTLNITLEPASPLMEEYREKSSH